MSSTVSTGCGSCSPYSYCKGDGDTAECDCLPGHKKMGQNKCLSKHIYLITLVYFKVVFKILCFFIQFSGFNICIVPADSVRSLFSCSAFCSSRDCDINAQCSTQGSKISCTCNPNYQGDGKICVPRNPCLENSGGCPTNSTVCVFKGPNKVRNHS